MVINDPTTDLYRGLDFFSSNIYSELIGSKGDVIPIPEEDIASLDAALENGERSAKIYLVIGNNASEREVLNCEYTKDPTETYGVYTRQVKLLSPASAYREPGTLITCSVTYEYFRDIRDSIVTLFTEVNEYLNTVDAIIGDDESGLIKEINELKTELIYTYIYTIEDLQKIGNDPDYPSNGNYKQAQDIDASITETWNEDEEVLSGYKGFLSVNLENGSYDGCGYSISNLHMDRITDVEFDFEDENLEGSFGIFKVVNESEVKNVVLNNCFGMGSSGGLLCATLRNSLLENCKVIGHGKIISEEEISVFGTSFSGGLVGIMYSSRIFNCSVSISGNMIGTLFTGGVVGGYYGEENKIYGCKFDGSFGGNIFGGIVCGGLLGGTFIPEGEGYDPRSIEILYSGSNRGNISKTDLIEEEKIGFGGLCGILFDGKIKNCYSKISSITADNNVGGLLGGCMLSEIKNCYSACQISCDGEYVGGNIGAINFPSFEDTNTIEDCYYDSDVSGQSDDDGRGIPLLTSEMVGVDEYGNPLAYENWDLYGIWKFKETLYPNLFLLLSYKDSYSVHNPVRYANGNYFVGNYENTIILDGTEGNVGIHLLKGVQGRQHFIKCISDGGNDVKVYTDVGDSFDDSVSEKTLFTGDVLRISYFDDVWYIL